MDVRVAGVAGLCIIACGPAPLKPRDPTPGVAHFKLQTFNVEQSHFSDPPTVEAIGAAGADIICLQEIQPEWETAIRARYADEYPEMLFYPVPGSDGLGVISKYPIYDQGYHQAPTEWHPAWHILVDTPMGPVQVLNVHLRSVFRGEPGKVESYLTLNQDHLLSIQEFSSDCLTGLPTLVAGDFNEEPDGSGVKYLESQGYRNALPLYHPGQGTWRDPPAWQFEQTIDHVLFNSSFVPLNAWVENAGNSDHIPVVVHVEAAPL